MLYFQECLKSENLFFPDGPPTLASASETGHISLWDLGSGGRLLHTVRGAHEGSISALEWISGQPLLISSGDDNSVKVCFEIGHVVYLADISQAMAFRFADHAATSSQISIGPPSTSAPHSILWRRWKTIAYSVKGP